MEERPIRPTNPSTMQTIEITLTPEQYNDGELLKQAVSRQSGIAESDIGHVEVVRRSLDSRRGIHYHVTVQYYLTDETCEAPDYSSPYRDCSHGRPVVIVGAGPAGLFAALRALELGLRPIIVERGQPVDRRKRDITQMVRSGGVPADSNWCYGEGGAGTYSDGKLYTRSNKRGNVAGILKRFVAHGADPKIMIDAHAHIGTDRLSGIIANIRSTIEGHGGTYHFNQRVSDLLIQDGSVKGVRCQNGETIEGDAVILATGHSARDIYELFDRRGWQLESKPFAMGVRVEHPQELINQIQYHSAHYSPLLPPAAYSLTTQTEGHGVFSFCMCPGGVIVPAATGDGEQVVNGMSNASRSSAFANSGIAVTVSAADAKAYGEDPLALLRFQQAVERRMYEAGGGHLNAPSQRLTDFCERRTTGQLNRSNYMGQCVAADLHEQLPPFIVKSLQQAFKDFNRKMRGFYTSEATLLAVESRTSSPIRIPRGQDGQHPQLKGLYPCGEGAGYAGGIVSSAMDGERAIENVFQNLETDQ